ncbi:hypothetical protein EDC04DRAFT_2758884 [Pisolithus marmoratus]|nr:hypothetical protein EDC04DRAFT_2758884 [Pisolithus marmoratus]
MVKRTKQLRLYSTTWEVSFEEKIVVGDAISVDGNAGAIEYDLESKTCVPLQKGNG